MYTKEDKQKALGVLWMSFRFNTHLQKYMAEPSRVLAEKYGLPKALLLNTYATLEHEDILTTCRGLRNNKKAFSFYRECLFYVSFYFQIKLFKL